MFFYIQSVSTGLVLDVTTDGPIITYEYHGGPNQLFRYDQETEMLHSALNGFDHLIRFFYLFNEVLIF